MREIKPSSIKQTFDNLTSLKNKAERFIWREEQDILDLGHIKKDSVVGEVLTDWKAFGKLDEKQLSQAGDIMQKDFVHYEALDDIIKNKDVDLTGIDISDLVTYAKDGKSKTEFLKHLLSTKFDDVDERFCTPEDIHMYMKSIKINNQADLEKAKLLFSKTNPKTSDYQYSPEDLKELMSNNINKVEKLFVAKEFGAYKDKIAALAAPDERFLLMRELSELSHLKGNIKDKRILEEIQKGLNHDGADYFSMHDKLRELQDLASIDGASYSLRGTTYEYLKKLKNPLSNKLSNVFTKETQIDSLKKYVTTAQKTNPKMADYVYEKYYLANADKKTASICKAISDKFKIKLFVEDEKDSKIATMVYRELEQWQKAGGKEFMAAEIPVISFSRVNAEFLADNPKGFIKTADKSIHVRGDDLKNKETVLRHEIAHSVDRKPKVDVDEIISSKKYYNEFLDAGLSESAATYGHTKREEFLAVASEGNYSKYSDEFKEVLITIGMPEWVFKMPPVKI